MSLKGSARERIDFFLALIGQDATVRLFEACGGQEVYFPRAPTGSAFDKLSSAVGDEAARTLCRELGTETLNVPFAKRWRVAIYHAQGLSVGKIAAKVGMLKRTVERTLNQTPAERRDIARKLTAKRNPRT